jgi:hypothetical protein
MRKLVPQSESKLSKTLAKIAHNEIAEKTGFIDNKIDKTIYFKTKSFRLRQADSNNLFLIVKEINKLSERKIYSDSEVIRGIINYISDNLPATAKKLLTYVRNSS